MSDGAGFLSRWSQRKASARQGEVQAEPVPPPASAPAAPQPAATTLVAPPALAVQSVDAAAPAVPAPARPVPPTLADVAALTRESDYSRFVAPGVDGEVKNAALKKLFGDPHFNVMDGLDTYIDDYNKPDPLPLSSVRKMAQAAFLGLIEAEPPSPAAGAESVAQAPKSAEAHAAAAAAAAAAATAETDENADLRLQPHDAAGRGGAEDGAAADGPGQH